MTDRIYAVDAKGLGVMKESLQVKCFVEARSIFSAVNEFLDNFWPFDEEPRHIQIHIVPKMQEKWSDF